MTVESAYVVERAKLHQFVASLDLEEGESRDGSLIEVLHEAQRLVGHLPPEIQRVVAGEMRLPLSRVYGVISFYHYFTTVPRGRHQIEVCMGTACYVRGAEKVVNKLESELGISVGEVTRDGEYSLESLRCVGACSLAPVVLVDKETHAHVQPTGVGDILAKYA